MIIQPYKSLQIEKVNDYNINTFLKITFFFNLIFFLTTYIFINNTFKNRFYDFYESNNVDIILGNYNYDNINIDQLNENIKNYKKNSKFYSENLHLISLCSLDLVKKNDNDISIFNKDIDINPDLYSQIKYSLFADKKEIFNYIKKIRKLKPYEDLKDIKIPFYKIHDIIDGKIIIKTSKNKYKTIFNKNDIKKYNLSYSKEYMKIYKIKINDYERLICDTYAEKIKIIKKFLKNNISSNINTIIPLSLKNNDIKISILMPEELNYIQKIINENFKNIIIRYYKYSSKLDKILLSNFNNKRKINFDIIVTPIIN